ncbi:MAG: hypothetical protein RID91_11910 [Azospirillaceae bacterium]
MTEHATSFERQLSLTEATELRAFAELIKEFDNQNDEQFRKLIDAAVNRHRITPSELSTEFAVSRASISRWIAGRSVPHPIARRAVADWLRERALRTADAIEAGLDDAA